MELLASLSPFMLGFFIGCKQFGVTELFIEDPSVRKKVHFHSIFIASIVSVYSIYLTHFA